ncbi:MAG: hypothetical protein PHI31_06585 [Desulfuromonadaceae bacterium]|nr:hypothetical protein [Desulfuromonadaceae bacterium]
MRVPFRQQATGYDCAPTSLINALCYLFKRAQLPPYVVHRVYKDSLDHAAARGTSSQAIMEMGHWLSCYREKRFDKFAVESSYIYGSEVHLRPTSEIVTCLGDGGAALICVHVSRYDRHCLLGLRYEGGWLYCYEPHPRTRRFIDCAAVQFIEPTAIHAPNVRIRGDWLEKDFEQVVYPHDRKYVFGSIDNRECLLLKRIHQKVPP